ncbi:hypothetical protein LCGC14_2607970 [marine sediment metagenome]|uniref:Uncharacterized protein n=1 Tax=marine sediment metagenome TaxID=412755 RepID=A0A0F9CHU4_9ZZZZ
MSDPIVTATPASMYGEVPENVVANPATSLLDLPGYSDRRTEIELAIRDGEDFEPLTHRFQLVRHAGAASRSAEWRREGYTTVKWDECVTKDGKMKKNEYGVDITGMPAAERMEDGTVRVGDLQLMVTPAENAARIAYLHQRQVKSDLDGTGARLEASAERARSFVESREQSRDEKLFDR